MNDLGFKNKKEVFKVPENYFVELEKNILKKTIESEEETRRFILKKKQIHLFSSVAGIAASLLLLFGIFYQTSNTKLTEDDIVSAENSLYNTLLEEDTFSDDYFTYYEVDYYDE